VRVCCVCRGARDFLPSLEAKETPPDLWFLSVISLINILVEKIQQHYAEDVAPRVLALGNMMGASLRLRDALAPLEHKILQALDRCLNAALKYIQRLLQKHQKGTDYKPKDESALLDPAPSRACDAVCGYLASAFESVMAALEGKNLDKFLSVFGLKLYSTLVEHLQRLQVSQIGAGLLARDVKEYESIVREFYLNAVTEKFYELRTVCHLFFVGVDNLRALILTDNKLSKMDANSLHDFIRMRTDYNANRAKILNVLRLDGSAAVGSSLQAPSAPSTPPTLPSPSSASGTGSVLSSALS
jgi:hypothetical protein